MPKAFTIFIYLFAINAPAVFGETDQLPAIFDSDVLDWEIQARKHPGAPVLLGRPKALSDLSGVKGARPEGARVPLALSPSNTCPSMNTPPIIYIPPFPDPKSPISFQMIERKKKEGEKEGTTSIPSGKMTVLLPSGPLVCEANLEDRFLKTLLQMGETEAWLAAQNKGDITRATLGMLLKKKFYGQLVIDVEEGPIEATLGINTPKQKAIFKFAENEFGFEGLLEKGRNKVEGAATITTLDNLHFTKARIQFSQELMNALKNKPMGTLSESIHYDPDRFFVEIAYGTKKERFHVKPAVQAGYSDKKDRPFGGINLQFGATW